MLTSDEQNVECPLCMEPFEIDDVTFYPCTCGYQICRFCWHRIRTDENGLCPACRKPYTEDPADFKPLSFEELHKLKNEKKQKHAERKQKLIESRKPLVNVRVVQKNLVFVVGLPPRLADADVLKKHDCFGKFGRIHKVVVNQNASYAGGQSQSCSAYVTYYRTEDAFQAICTVNNLRIDGRTLKASLGTTKYCNFFLKGQACTKSDCMYLHDLGDSQASFTKEDMQQGKHQEYERRLCEKYLGVKATQRNRQKSGGENEAQILEQPPPPLQQQPSSSSNNGTIGYSDRKSKRSQERESPGVDGSRESSNYINNCQLEEEEALEEVSETIRRCDDEASGGGATAASCRSDQTEGVPIAANVAEAVVGGDESNSSGLQPLPPPQIAPPTQLSPQQHQQQQPVPPLPPPLEMVSDELDFDPWNESQKALADLIEKEQRVAAAAMMAPPPPSQHFMHNPPPPPHMMSAPPHMYSNMEPPPPQSVPPMMLRRHLPPPPGFSSPPSGPAPSFGGPFGAHPHPSTGAPMHPPPDMHHQQHHMSVPPMGHTHHMHGAPAPPPQQQQQQPFSLRQHQDALRSLLPTVRISFDDELHQRNSMGGAMGGRMMPMGPGPGANSPSWQPWGMIDQQDPAIVAATPPAKTPLRY